MAFFGKRAFFIRRAFGLSPFLGDTTFAMGDRARGAVLLRLRSCDL